MAGQNTSNSQLLIRSEVWSEQLKEVLKDELNAKSYVEWIDFPTADVLTIPSIGDLDASDYFEDSAVEYTALATGEMQFSITEYKSSATYITRKMRQDSYVAARVEAAFVPEQARAIAVGIESFVLNMGQPGTVGGQTASSLNNINNAAHRWVGADTANSTRTIGFKDFAKAEYALRKANVPMNNLVAIVDPSVGYHLSTLSQTLDVTYNPMWEGIITNGLMAGMKFSRNIYGFDVYVSNYLPTITAGETIDSVASGTNAVANLFCSLAPNVRPFLGAMKQMPIVDAEWNKDFQREEYVTTARYGGRLQRPENFITVLSSTNVIV